MQYLDGVSQIINEYDYFILDIWGVIHDGQKPYPCALDTLKYLKANNKKICLLSNAPRRSDKVAEVLLTMNISSSFYDIIITSGELVYDYLKINFEQNYSKFSSNYGYIGPKKDIDLIKNLEYNLVEDFSKASFLINTGFDSDDDKIANKMPKINEAKKYNLPMICANPDMVVIRQNGQEMLCAGVIAKEYERIGGEVQYFGKPFSQIYNYAVSFFENLAQQKLSRQRIIAIGDGLETDIKGANSFGIDNILLTGGILCNQLGVKFDGKPNLAKLEKICQNHQIFPKFTTSILKI